METCPVCKEKKENVIRRHRNTAFADDEQNFMVSCKDCFQEDWDYYQERWDDYYADILEGIGSSMTNSRR